MILEISSACNQVTILIWNILTESVYRKKKCREIWYTGVFPASVREWRGYVCYARQKSESIVEIIFPVQWWYALLILFHFLMHVVFFIVSLCLYVIRCRYKNVVFMITGMPGTNKVRKCGGVHSCFRPVFRS